MIPPSRHAHSGVTRMSRSSQSGRSAQRLLIRHKPRFKDLAPQRIAQPRVTEDFCAHQGYDCRNQRRHSNRNWRRPDEEILHQAQLT